MGLCGVVQYSPSHHPLLFGLGLISSLSGLKLLKQCSSPDWCWVLQNTFCQELRLGKSCSSQERHLAIPSVVFRKDAGKPLSDLASFYYLPKGWEGVKVSLSPDNHLTICVLKLGGQFSTSGLGNATSQLSFFSRSAGRDIVVTWPADMMARILWRFDPGWMYSRNPLV